MLKMIVVRNMFHNILYRAAKDVAKPVDGVDLHILVFAQAVYLGAVHIVVGVQVVL